MNDNSARLAEGAFVKDGLSHFACEVDLGSDQLDGPFLPVDEVEGFADPVVGHSLYKKEKLWAQLNYIKLVM